MKKIISVIAILLAITVSTIVVNHYTVAKNIAMYSDDARYIAWCDSIYHQNVGCPKHGKVVIPPAVLAKQEAEHLAWCKEINHRNVSCPKYGR